jgi:hypothetical protein
MSPILTEARVGPPAEQFIRERLAKGCTLAKAALQALPLAQGQIVTLLPPGVLPQSVDDFGTGGKLPPLPETEWKTAQSRGEALRMIPVPNTDSWLVAKIKDHLGKAADHVCVFEDQFKQPKDPVVQKLLTRYATFNDEVYHLLFQDDAEDQRILDTIRGAKGGPIFIGVLTTWPLEPRVGGAGVLSRAQLQTLAASAQKLFVGAYDGEGYLIWTR